MQHTHIYGKYFKHNEGSEMNSRYVNSYMSSTIIFFTWSNIFLIFKLFHSQSCMLSYYLINGTTLLVIMILFSFFNLFLHCWFSCCQLWMEEGNRYILATFGTQKFHWNRSGISQGSIYFHRKIFYVPKKVYNLWVTSLFTKSNFYNYG